MALLATPLSLIPLDLSEETAWFLSCSESVGADISYICQRGVSVLGTLSCSQGNAYTSIARQLFSPKFTEFCLHTFVSTRNMNLPMRRLIIDGRFPSIYFVITICTDFCFQKFV